MAHEYALELLKTTHANHGYLGEMEIEHIKDTAFALAEAMQAEAEKRKPKEEWQPDWSQAPDNLVRYFAVDESGRGGWFITKPKLCSDHWYWSDWSERDGKDNYDHAPSFGYTGNWKDSLRKRP